MPTRYIRKTKNYFLKKNLQGKIVLVLFLTVFGSCIFFAILLGIFSADTMTISYSNNDIRVGATPWILFQNAVAANWIFLITGGVVLVLAAIVATHRIAGPLYHFEKSLKEMSEGNLSGTIQLRSKDVGKNLAKEINHFNEILREQLSTIENHSERIASLIEELENLENRNAEVKAGPTTLQKIKNHNNQIKHSILFFNLHKNNR